MITKRKMKTNTLRQAPLESDEERRTLKEMGLIAKWIGPNQNVHAYIKRDGLKNFDFDAFTYDNVVLRNVPTVADMLKWKTAMEHVPTRDEFESYCKVLSVAPTKEEYAKLCRSEYDKYYAKLKELFNPKAKKVGYSNRYGAWEVIALRDIPDIAAYPYHLDGKVLSNDGLIHVILKKGKIQEAIDQAIEVKPLAEARRDRLQHQLQTYMTVFDTEETEALIEKYELKLQSAKNNRSRQRDIKQKLKELYAKREELEMPQREDNELLRDDYLTSWLYKEDYDAERSRNREPNVKPSACRIEDLELALATSD